MSTVASCNAQDLGRAIVDLLNRARRQDERDRRSDVRYPFFSPVNLVTEDGIQLFGFSRDVSRGGMGLLLAFPLDVDQRVRLIVQDETDKQSAFVVRCAWSQPCGEGWWLCGAKFLDLES